MSSDELTDALATLRAYSAHCHDETAKAGLVVCAAYDDLLVLWASQTAQCALAEDRVESQAQLIDHLTASIARWRETSQMQQGAIEGLKREQARLQAIERAARNVMQQLYSGGRDKLDFTGLGLALHFEPAQGGG